MKRKGRKKRVWKVIFRDLYWNRKIRTCIIEALKGATVSPYCRTRLLSAYVVPQVCNHKERNMADLVLIMC